MRWFKNLKTRSKLLLGFGVMCVLLIGLAAMGYKTLVAIQKTEREEVDQSRFAAKDAVEIRADQNRIRGDMLEFLIAENTAKKTAIKRDVEERSKNISLGVDRIKAFLTSQNLRKELALVAELEKELADWKTGPKLKELKAKELPRLDDDFAKDLGAENLAALEERVRGSIRLRREREAEAERRKRALAALVEANPFDLPPSLIRAQTDQMIAGAAARVQQMMGKKLQLSDEELANLRQDSASDAEQTVRSGILMLEVAKHAGLKVEEAEIEAEIERLVAQAGGNPQRVRSHYADPENRSSIRFRAAASSASAAGMASPRK